MASESKTWRIFYISNSASCTNFANNSCIHVSIPWQMMTSLSVLAQADRLRASGVSFLRWMRI